MSKFEQAENSPVPRWSLRGAPTYQIDKRLKGFAVYVAAERRGEWYERRAEAEEACWLAFLADYHVKVCAVRYSNGWYRHEIEGTPFFINANARGTVFDVMESGADISGMAYKHGRVSRLAEAVLMATSLKPSTVADICNKVLAEVPEWDTRTRKRLSRTAQLAEPGTRLWTPPLYTDRYEGLGEAATALGLGRNSIEALFGSSLRSVLVKFRTDSGQENSLAELVVLTLEDARARWWIVDADGKNLVSGGHPDRERMVSVRDEEHPGCLVMNGTEFMPVA